MASFRVLLYYFFGEIGNPAEFTEVHREECVQLGLRGRILVAKEGINGTVSGPVEACSTYMSRLSSLFPGIEFKVDEADGHVFKAMHVRLRPEIITLGQDIEGPTAPHLSPVEWREKMKQENVVLLDGRNNYESDLGRFEGAICPPLEAFRDFPDWIREHRELLVGKTVLTYCTGGIRCEKLSAWMLQEGFSNVYQLHGGICNYAKDELTQGEGFEGVNVVFDDRIAVSAGARASELTHCRECGQKTTNYVNCANVLCNARLILCPSCEVTTERCCSEECRQAPKRRHKDRKLAESLGVPLK